LRFLINELSQTNHLNNPISSSNHGFVPNRTPLRRKVESAVDNMYPDFRVTDNLVARNTSRVLKAFQNARVGSHVCHNVIITLIYRHYHIIMFVAYFAQQLLISCFITRIFM
ncbi:hypothetical protein M8C21_014727, partial [Ambrosia artemisiifolia]